MTPTRQQAAPLDARPCYRIAVFGLGHRFQRLLEIIVRHARHNNYRYQLAEQPGPGEFDIALVDMTAKGGLEVARTLRSVPQALPVIGVGRRANHKRGNDDLLLATFSLDVLGVLNKASESLSLRDKTRRLSERLLQAGSGLRLPMISGRPPRALVIEPSPSVRSQLAAALRQIGVDAEGVGTLAQATDVLSMRSYELLILEPAQPDGDGLAMLRRLRNEATLSIPVIVLSSHAGLFDLAKAAWAGCKGYLGKPVPLSTLHSTVNRVLMKSLRPRLNAERKAAGLEPLSGPDTLMGPPTIAASGRARMPTVPERASVSVAPPLPGTLEYALAALSDRTARESRPAGSLAALGPMQGLSGLAGHPAKSVAAGPQAGGRPPT